MISKTFSSTHVYLVGGTWNILCFCFLFHLKYKGHKKTFQSNLSLMRKNRSTGAVLTRLSKSAAVEKRKRRARTNTRAHTPWGVEQSSTGLFLFHRHNQTLLSKNASHARTWEIHSKTASEGVTTKLLFLAKKIPNILQAQPVSSSLHESKSGRQPFTVTRTLSKDSLVSNGCPKSALGTSLDQIITWNMSIGWTLSVWDQCDKYSKLNWANVHKIFELLQQTSTQRMIWPVLFTSVCD